jgi:hypothetical protein
MNSLGLLREIESLPASLKAEVEDFVAFLKQKTKKTEPSAQANKREFGALKGMFVIPTDFDAPLDDLKDYM